MASKTSDRIGVIGRNKRFPVFPCLNSKPSTLFASPSRNTVLLHR
ncbi:hypothetical protein BRUCa_1468 [Brucella melitensis]